MRWTAGSPASAEFKTYFNGSNYWSFGSYGPSTGNAFIDNRFFIYQNRYKSGAAAGLMRLMIDEGGNFGIGTTLPAAILDVNGVGSVSSALIVPRDTTGNRPTTPVNGMIRYASDTAKFEAYQSWLRGRMSSVRPPAARRCPESLPPRQ